MLLYVSNTVFVLLLIEYLIIFAEKKGPTVKRIEMCATSQLLHKLWEHSIFYCQANFLLTNLESYLYISYPH